MNRSRFFTCCTRFTALAVTGLIANAGAVMAQQASDDQTGQAIEEIVKVEAQLQHRFDGPPSATGSRTEIFELKRQVSFADLDLRKAADVAALKKRIEVTAKESCEELARINPMPAWNSADIQRCARKAVASANDGLEAALLVAAVE